MDSRTSSKNQLGRTRNITTIYPGEKFGSKSNLSPRTYSSTNSDDVPRTAGAMTDAKADTKANVDAQNERVNECMNQRVIMTSERKSLISHYTCIPIRRQDKTPLIKWKRLTQSPSVESFYSSNIAVKTGSINQIMVVDIDLPKPDRNEKDGMKWYSDYIAKVGELDTPICVTQSGGIHLYFKYDKQIKTSTFVNGYSVDIRAQGAYVVCPDSIGTNGEYCWKTSLLDKEPMAVPKDLKKWIMQHQTKDIAKGDVKAKCAKEPQVSTKRNVVYIYTESQIRDLLKELPSKYLNSYVDWVTVTSCLKSEGDRLKQIWDEWSAKSTKYDQSSNNAIWDSLTPKVDINYLAKLAKQTPFGTTQYVKDITTKPDIELDTRFVSLSNVTQNPHNQLHRCTLLKSPCGTGKTRVTSAMIDKIKHKGSCYRFLSITCRRTLAFEQKSVFKDASVYSDLDVDGLNNCTDLIIQLDSLHKLDIARWGRNTIVYLDELSTLLSYMLSSKTLKEKRNAIYRKLCTILKGASYIIGTDADLDDMCLKLFQGLNIPYRFIHNKYRGDPIPASAYSDEEDLIQKMEQELLAGNRVFGAFDSKRKMEIVVQRLKHFCEDNNLDDQLEHIRVYSSTDGDKTDMLSVFENWHDNNVFFSPCVTVGVSYTDEARKVFLFSDGCSVNSRTLIQMLCRCRNIQELHFYVRPRYVALRQTSVDDVRNYYAKLVGSYTSTVCDAKTGDHNGDDTDEFHGSDNDNTIIDALDQSGQIAYDYQTGTSVVRKDLFNELYYYHAYYDRILRSATSEQFKNMLIERNFVITDDDKTTVAVVTESTKTAKTAKIAKTTKAVKTVKSKPASAVKTTKQKNDRAKEALKDQKERKINRALYSNQLTLTKEEKDMRDDMKMKSSIVGINFSHSGQKRKYAKYISDEKAFDGYMAYSLLLKEETEIDAKSRTELAANGKINSMNSTVSKVKLIKRLETALNVQTLDIDSQRDKHRFDERLDLNADLKKTLVRVFRIRKSADVDDNTYEYWYRKLATLYKGLLGADVVEVINSWSGKIKLSRIKTNKDVINDYHDLYLEKPNYKIEERIV